MRPVSFRWFLALLPFALVCLVRADGPGDNLPDKVRPIPPRGVKLSRADRTRLRAGVEELGKEIDALRKTLAGKPDLRELLPDVEVYHQAVRIALTYHEFFDPKEVAAAHDLLKQGRERARQLRQGKAPWNTATGLVVRGYVSKIDGSVQPYGLMVPASYRPKAAHRFRLDVWCHGRNETLSEVNFIRDRQASAGEFAPANAFVLHPYGRYCNANKFAGEIDLFEALAHVRKHYPIDEDRLVMRGFSMGGAACWQFAVHYPSTWVAAAPGAGFSETADFLKVFQKETLRPTWYEKKLWHMYDCTDYALNLFNCPTVAYSGSRDSQKQAADMMARALKTEGIELVHVIGQGAGHFYTPRAKTEINRRIDRIAEAGRNPVPAQVHFTTWTLRYHRCFWVRIDGLGQHWERARVDAVLTGGARGGPKIKTKNVSALTLTFPPGRCPLDVRKQPEVEIDGEKLAAPRPLSDRSWVAHFRRVGGKWRVVKAVDDGRLRKRHGLQGPIDDTFMDSFLMVRPTGKALNDKVGKWAAAEMRHALDHWRRQFRGEPRVKDDRDVTAADVAAHNLVLWGDPGSNRLLAKIAGKLPIRWDRDGVWVGKKKFAAASHVPVLIYPNPLNPKRYVVLNSGFTYREYDYLNNSRQVPKLPDFAVIDIRVPVTSRAPGGVVAAGFFTERWRLPAAAKE
jgi:pimeloyl-ACP methyl ester carboxylesterase